MISRSFQTVRRVREAWKWGNIYVRSQSLSSESAVKSLPTAVPRRAKKDSNIPSPGEQDWSNALPLAGLTKTIKSPPHALPAPPLALH